MNNPVQTFSSAQLILQKVNLYNEAKTIDKDIKAITKNTTWVRGNLALLQNNQGSRSSLFES